MAMHYKTFGLIFFMSMTTLASELDFEIKPESTISYRHGYDSDKNQSYHLFVDLESAKHQRLSLAYSRSNSVLDDSNFHSYHLLLSTSPYETISLDAGLSYSNLPDSLQNYTINNTLNLNLENWHFSTSPQLSTINFILNSSNDNQFNVSAKGIAFSGNYFGLMPYYISGRYFKQFFSEKPLFFRANTLSSINVNTLNRIRIFSRINTLGSNLEEQRISATVGRYFHWGSLDFTYYRIQLFNVAQWLDFPALDNLSANNVVDAYSCSGYVTVNKHISASLSLGWQTLSTESNKLIFTSAELSYHW